MAASAMDRKSVTDLTRRKGRAFFTVLTLAIAVASIGIFAVPSLLQQAMDREIASTRLADLTVTMNPLLAHQGQQAHRIVKVVRMSLTVTSARPHRAPRLTPDRRCPTRSESARDRARVNRAAPRLARTACTQRPSVHESAEELQDVATAGARSRARPW
jgi:putative ABC transport system permease protein